MLRPPAVAGAFYPGDKPGLLAALKRCFAKGIGSDPVKGNSKNLCAAVAPHAGYVYSGLVASFTFSAIASAFATPPLFVILGPNHTGYGSPISISQRDWATPLGIVKNDSAFAKLITKNSRLASFDEQAHDQEHSVEVQLPFLQYIYGSTPFSFVPICMMAQDSSAAIEIAEAIYKAEKESKRKIFVLASSDFTHFESAESAEKKDKRALAALEKLDVEGFERAKEETDASICGYGPIMVAAHYAKLKGCKSAHVLKYSNSGEVSGDYEQVVAYCSVEFRLK